MTKVWESSRLSCWSLTAAPLHIIGFLEHLGRLLPQAPVTGNVWIHRPCRNSRVSDRDAQTIQPLNNHIVQAFNHSMAIQSFNHSTIIQLLNHSIIQSFNNHSITQPFNHSTTIQSFNHSITQPFNHSITQPYNHS